MVVVVAVRRDGAVGYFATLAEVPDGWRPADEPRDIADVMASLGTDREHALRAMNAHWQA